MQASSQLRARGAFGASRAAPRSVVVRPAQAPQPLRAPRRLRAIELDFSDPAHPITGGVAAFAMKDEIYYDMDLRADIHVLATAPTPKKTIAQPQVWTYEKPCAQRAFVFIPGHDYVNFSRPDVRTLLLRGIAWAGRRVSIESYATQLTDPAPAK